MISLRHIPVLALVSFILSIVSCTKEDSTTTNDNTKHYSNSPSIKFISLTPSSVSELDSITFTIYYEDGDGDLGENNYAAKNIFITDLRDSTTDSLRIPQLIPDSTSVPVNGNLKVILTDLLLKQNPAIDTVTYAIQVVDRAGNRSNIVKSSTITINHN